MGNQIRESIKFQGEERLTSIANSLKETVNDARQVQKEIDELNKKKLKIEVDENGFKIIKKGLDTIKQELSDQKIKKTDFFNNEGVQRDIEELMSTLDNAYDKIINKGQKLSQEETDIFVKSYAKLNQLGDKAGEDFAAKYHNLFDSFFNQLKTQAWDNKSFDPMSKDYYNSIVTPILESFTKEFVRRHVENIRNELAQRKYESNESQRNEIKGVKSEIDVAKNNKREILRKGQEEVQGLLDGLNSQRLDGEVFNIDLSKFAKIQEAFRILIQLLTEANIDTIKLEDSFQQFTQGVYIPKEQVDGAKQSLSEANAEIEQLKEQVSQLQQLLSSAPSMDEFNKLKQDYEAAQEKIEQLTNSMSNLMSLTENSVSSSEYQNMTQEATQFIEEWRKAQQELVEVKKQLAEIREERDRLLEEREALRQTKEEINKETDGVNSKVSSKFKPSNLQSFIDLLSQIESHLHTLRDAFGSVDDNSGFKNIIDSITILLDKLSDIQNRFDSGILNVTVNKTGITAADTVVNEELERLMDKYNEFISIFGGESNLFNTISAYSASTIDFDKYYSSSALKDIIDPLQKVNRLQEFFKDIETSLQNLKGMKKILRDDASTLREQIKELEANSDAYDFINSSDGQSMAKGAIDQLKGRLKSINQLLKILRSAEKFEAPETSAEEISQKIKNKNMNLLEEEDLEGLDKVVFQLERIAELLSEISQKDLLGNSVETLSKQLDDLIGKFQIVIETIQTTKTTSIANTTTTSANGINALISSEEKARNAIDETNTAIEKQNTESSQLGTQISQINTLADSNKNLAVSVNSVSDATNQVEKKTSILQRFFEWLGKIKDKFKDAFSINANSNSAADGLEKQINAVDKASEKYNQSIDKLEKMAEKYRRVNQSEVNQTVDTSTQDKLQAELTETTQKAKEASEALKEEKQVSNAPLPFTVSESEIESINAVRDALNTVIEYIQLKNEMFQKEGQIVAGVTQSEVTDLTILLGWLWDIEKEVADIGTAFEKNLNYTPNLDIATLDKFITKIKNLKPDKLGLNLIGIYDWIDDFIKAMNSVKLDSNSFFGQLTEFFDKSEELKAIATIIKASKKEIDDAKSSTNTKQGNDEKKDLQTYIQLRKDILNIEYKIAELKAKGYSSDTYEGLERNLNTLKQEENVYKYLLDSEENRLTIQKEIANEESRLAKLKEDNVRRSDAEQDKIANKEKANYTQQGNLLKQINGWIKKNTIGYKAYQEQLNTLVNRLSSGATLTENELREIKDSFTQITNEATVAGKTGLSVIDMIKNRWKSVIAYTASFMSFYRIAGYIRTALNTIQDLDTQLVDLRKTTQMNVSELNEFYIASTDLGKELGVTTSEIISQAAAWSRLGYNTKEATEQMAALSSKFASISPGVEVDNATDYLVSTMQAFKVLPENVERDIMDNINAIGNTMATTNGEIGEMLERSSAAMKAANNTLEETIALEAAAVEITRNAETTGTAFRTISMRIRGYDEETEELSDDLKNISGEIADLTKTTKNAPISIFTDKAKTEYKSTYQILKEIAGIWENLTDKQQAQLLEKLGGKRGAQSLAGILADFSSVEEALQTMSEAGGSAEREMNIIRESLDFKVNALKQTWVGILQDLIDRGVISDVVDGLTKISESLGKLITQFGVLKTAVVSIGGLFTAKKLGLFNLLKGDFSGIDNLKNKVIELSVSGQSLKEVSKSINEIQAISASRDILTSEGINVTTIELYRKSLQGLTVDQKALALSTSGLTKAEIEEVLTRQDSAIVSQAISKAEAEAVISKMGLASATKVLSESELEELGTRVGLEAQTIKNALIETGLVTVKDGDIIATQKLTQSEIEEALTSQGAALADKQQTAQIIAETIAKKQATQATVKYAGTSNLLVGAFNKLKAVITKHPLLTLATIIGGSIYALRKYKNSIDDLIDSSKEIVSTYQSTSKELAKNKGEFDSLSEKYVELSKGVDSLGHNVNLTTDEYEEYRTVVNRIADLSPDLISGYNDQGDAILYIRDSVDALTDSYNKNIIAANNDIIANGTKVMEARKESKLQYGNEDNVNRYRLQSIEELLKGSKNASQLMNDFADLYSGGFMGYEYKDLTKLLNELGIDVGFTKDDEWYTTEAEAAEFNKKLQDTLEHLTSDQRAILEAYVSRKNAEYENIFEGDRELLKAYIQNSLLTDEDLKEIPDNLKTILMNYADNIDVDILSTFDSPEKLSSYASQITNAFKGLSDSQQKQLEFGINLSTSWNNNELSYDEYIEQIQAFNTLLSELFPDNEEIQKTFKILFDIPNEEDLVKQKDIFLNRISETKTSSMKLDPEISDEAIQEAINKGNEVAEAWYNSLTKSERDFVANVSDEDFAKTIKFDSTKQFDAWLDKLKNVATKEKIDPINAVDVVDSIADAKTAITSLEELWNQTVKNTVSLGKDKKYLDANGNVIKQLNDQNQAAGYADPALINNVESSFYKFSEKLKKEGNDAAANEINLALENFEKTLTEFPHDAKKAQDAIDNLITAYIDQTDIIQNLTEENAEWSEAQLQAMGITNAHEVVQSRLSKEVKATQKAIKQLSDALTDYKSAIADGLDGTEAFQEVVKYLQQALSLYDENGEVVMTPEFDDSFVQKHMEDVEAMAAGDVEALNRVRRAAAEEAVLKVTASIPTEAAMASIQNLMNECMKLDAMDIEVGASVNDADFIAGLNNMIKSGKYTADQVSAALESMGYTATWTPNRYTAKTVTAITTSAGDPKTWNTAQLQAWKGGIALKHEEATLDIPSLTITRKGKAGGGSVAHYGGGGSKSSGGGGGGGGGGGSSSEPNKPKQETEETFDWIEVAIQRIEEEINRLDKVVGNSYDIWINRNKALLKEIDKTREEIKAQQIAYSEYLRNANDVKVNNGKGLNPDDYGENDAEVKKRDQELLDEAKAAWKTGEYQKKVREGLLTGDDIENIANHFLSDTIKSYQEL